ncbi:NACHT domain-containing protein [Actinoplanes sp. NPDC000266]
MLQVLFGVVGGLIVVPTAINVTTGGELPERLRPFAGWLWPAAVTCLVLVVGLELWDKLRPGGSEISPHRPDDPKNIGRALKQVSAYVGARRGGLLAGRIWLHFDERPSAVRQPLHMVQRVSGTEFRLSPETGMIDVFDQMDESMLILGAPGSGKTTQLLDLAADLIVRAERNGGKVPVVLDLASWARPRRRWLPWPRRPDRGPVGFTEWLISELQRHYRIPVPIGRAWLDEGRLALLLDGLDEVREEFQERCVAEINAVQTGTRLTQVVVCSREADYDRLAARLRLQGAVVIRPLAKEEVVEFLAASSRSPAEAAAVLDEDADLWELLTTPLMLNVVMLAQGQENWQAVVRQDDPAERRRLLFDAYVVEVLARRRNREVEIPRRAVQAVRTLARASAGRREGVGVPRFEVDGEGRGRVFPEPAVDVIRLWLTPLGCTIAALVSVSAATVFVSAWAGWAVAVVHCPFLLVVSWGYRPSARRELAGKAAFAGYLALVTVTTAVCATGLMLLAERVPVPPWWVTFLLILGGTVLLGVSTGNTLRYGVIGFFGALLVAPLVSDRATVQGGVIGILTVLTVFWLVLNETVYEPADEEKDDPVLRRIRRVRIAVSMPLLFAVPLAGTWNGPFWSFLLGVVIGAVIGLMIALLFFVLARSVPLRFAFRIAGEPNPWRRSFLRFAVDRMLLVRTESEYRFVHLLIRDHLAACDPVELGAAVERRRAELAGSAS